MQCANNYNFHTLELHRRSHIPELLCHITTQHFAHKRLNPYIDRTDAGYDVLIDGVYYQPRPPGSKRIHGDVLDSQECIVWKYVDYSDRRNYSEYDQSIHNDFKRSSDFRLHWNPQ